MTEGVSSYISLFADDAKLLRKVGNHKDCEELQNDINKIYEWSKTWEMEFNAKKCHVHPVLQSRGQLRLVPRRVIENRVIEILVHM